MSLSTNLTLNNTSFSIASGKRTLAYYDSDQDSRYSSLMEASTSTKKVIILLHGYCGSSAYFSELIHGLAPTHRLLIPDLMGHGASESLNQATYALHEVAALLGGWLQGIGVRSAYIFGHSLGGYITLELTRQFPELLAGFGLLHSTALPDTEQAKANREKAIQTVQEQGVAAFVDGLIPKLLAKDHPAYDELLAAGVAIGYATKSEAVIGFARGMKERLDLTSIIESSGKPVLLIAGAKDDVIQPEATFAGSGEATSCHIIEEAGHMGMMEKPHQMAEIIQRFIG